MKTNYMLSGFGSKDEAQKRNHEFALKVGIKEGDMTKYLFTSHCLAKEQKENWGLEIPEEYLHLLDDKEKQERLIQLSPIANIDFYFPPVFRYMEKKYIDLFFNEGKIRLSSFAKFHFDTDKQRGDNMEGRGLICLDSEHQSTTIVASSGVNSFVLSSSLIMDTELLTDFNVDGCFAIEDPINFLATILEQIPECFRSNLGPCYYKREHKIERNGNFTLKDLKSDDYSGYIDFDKFFNHTTLAHLDQLFTKRLEYANQHEFRFIWHTNSISIPDHIDITVPDAVKFCRRIL